jgi:hypothetical protein
MSEIKNNRTKRIRLPVAIPCAAPIRILMGEIETRVTGRRTKERIRSYFLIFCRENRGSLGNSGIV